MGTEIELLRAEVIRLKRELEVEALYAEHLEYDLIYAREDLAAMAEREKLLIAMYKANSPVYPQEVVDDLAPLPDEDELSPEEWAEFERVLASINPKTGQ